MNSTTTPSRRPSTLYVVRALFIHIGDDLSLIPRVLVSAAFADIWYRFLIPSSHQSLRSIGAAIIFLGLVWGLSWGRKVARTCPHCRALHKSGAAVCDHCGRDVPSARQRIRE